MVQYYKGKAKKVDFEDVLLKQKHGDISRVAKSCFWVHGNPGVRESKDGHVRFWDAHGTPMGRHRNPP